MDRLKFTTQNVRGLGENEEESETLPEERQIHVTIIYVYKKKA